jgi:serine-type D-Ala-D-Ala carboxypeptidase/endopeptidase (penicillin-binding protein 4)
MSGAARGVPRRALRPLAVLVAALALFAVGAEPIAEATTSGSATLQASKPQVTFGGWVVFSGAIAANDPCRAGRTWRLRMAEPGATQWTVLWSGTTKPDGSFERGVQPDHTARYQAYLPLTPTCDAVTSNRVRVPVAVRITMSGPPDGIPAGSCGTVRAAVAPPEPGTQVVFQRLEGSGWTTVATATLSSSSRAFTERCTTWPDIGTEWWRVTWSAAAAHDQLNADGVAPSLAVQVVKAYWMRHIDQLVGGHNTGIAVFQDGRPLYERADTVAHVPASNEKLLLSMALLDRADPGRIIATRAEAPSVSNGVVPGNLWLVGRGDPTVTKVRMQSLAQAVVQAGVKRIKGSVMGSTSYFAHDWFAPGWKPDFPADEVALPTALTYRGNQVRGRHVRDPEHRAAVAFTTMLENRGVKVAGKAGAGPAPGGLHTVAHIDSPSLQVLLHRQNVDSLNFSAEVLGKLLGALASGAPGTIHKGAAAIAAWAGEHGASVVSEDSSGLSYANRATPLGIVRLLHVADGATWGPALRATLATPGHGTLEDRLAGIPVVAKTGTLDDVSALSGWVRLSRTGEWATFSILSGGFSPTTAKSIEDAVVTTLYHYGH